MAPIVRQWAAQPHCFRSTRMLERRVIEVEGTVQGVGFRPYVHRLAAAGDLRGFVRNEASRVIIDVEGEESGVDAFCVALTSAPPALSAISSVRITSATPTSCDTFRIAPSLSRADDSDATGRDAMRASGVVIPPDVATCDACLTELWDANDRRHGYPFINCTECGPRFTILREAPYDRERTTMGDFPLCAHCEREYHDPRDRRFHAETIACPECGPTLVARALAGEGDAQTVAGGRRPDALARAIAVLRGGGIVALKALGGFHLACDATDARVVDRLRLRKHRPVKPFAIMVRNASAAEALCEVSPVERAALMSSARPVVLLAHRAATPIADNVASGNASLGVMLPSTPLHHLLLAAVDGPLVMTSGNRRGEPVVIDDTSAHEALGDVADVLLTHDRTIATRCDDSVVRVLAGESRQVRRSRGYVPQAIAMPFATRVPILAVGGHQKNTVCIMRGARAYLSAHVGDMDSAATRDAFRLAIANTAAMAGAQAEIIAHDLHPDYGSTRMVESVASEYGITRRIAVQHHHAHVAACAAEYSLREPVIGVAFDGAGLGSDGATWGGEFLVVDGARFVRAGHLRYVPLPGGDAVARRPWRSAAAHMAGAGIDATRIRQRRPATVAEQEWRLVHQLVSRENPQHRTSSVGRLFDAVASLLDLCHVADFEGEAAMALESVASTAVEHGYLLTIGRGAPWTIDPSPIIRGVLADLERGRHRSAIASAFHTALRDMVVLGCERIREETGLATVVLTGGVFMNKRLTESTHAALMDRRFHVLLPRLVPCNDGGLALGQAHVAACSLGEDLCA